MSLFYKNYVDKSFDLSTQNIDKIIDEEEALFDEWKLSSEQKIKIRLSVETALVAWMENVPDAGTCRFKIASIFNQRDLCIELPGAMFNPLDSSDDYYSRLFHEMSNHSMVFSYHYTKGKNSLTMKLPRKTMTQTQQILLAVFLALITYGVMCFFPNDVMQMVSNSIIGPFFNLLMGLLSMVAILMLVFSMMAGICNMGDTNTVKQQGAMMFKQFAGRNLQVLLLALISAPFFFSVLDISSGVDMSIFKGVYDIIINSIPTNIIEPFQTKNSLQAVILGALVGSFLLLIKDKTEDLIKVVSQTNILVMSMITRLCQLMPLIIYLSITQLLCKGVLGNFMSVWKMFLYIAVFGALGALLSMVYIGFKLHISPLKLLKSSAPVGLTGFLTVSSVACIPQIYELCEKKYGVNHSFIDVTLPIQQVVYKPSLGLALVAISCYLCESYGMMITIPQYVTLAVVIFLLAIARPPIPGGLLTILAPLFAFLNLPAEAVAVPIALNYIIDMFVAGSKLLVAPMEIVLVEAECKKLNVQSCKTENK